MIQLLSKDRIWPLKRRRKEELPRWLDLNVFQWIPELVSLRAIERNITRDTTVEWPFEYTRTSCSSINTKTITVPNYCCSIKQQPTLWMDFRVRPSDQVSEGRPSARNNKEDRILNLKITLKRLKKKPGEEGRIFFCFLKTQPSSRLIRNDVSACLQLSVIRVVKTSRKEILRSGN